MTPYIVGIVIGALLIYFKNNYTNALGLLKNLKVKEEILDKSKEQMDNNLELGKLQNQVEELNKQIKEGKLSDEELAKWFLDSFNDDNK